MTPQISIIVRSHDDEPFIGPTLEGLLGQRDMGGFEILSCDDESADGTPQILAGFPCVRRIDRPPGRYIPGRTLNHALRHCRGEVIVFNNADAVPQGEDYLEKLTAPLFADAGVSAVYGNQLPRRTAGPLVRKDHRRAFGDGTTAAKWRCFFSLASAAIRKEELLRFPFCETLQYSEDVEWAWRCIGRGGRIVYAAAARVEHSHDYSAAELRRRFYQEGRAAARIFGAAPGVVVTLRQIAAEILRDIACLAREPGGWRWLAAAPRRRYLQRISFMRGARDYFREESSR